MSDLDGPKFKLHLLQTNFGIECEQNDVYKTVVIERRHPQQSNRGNLENHYTPCITCIYIYVYILILYVYIYESSAFMRSHFIRH